VCSGTLEDDVLTCPWHGYQYYVTNGELLLDASAHLETYPATVRDGNVYVTFPTRVMEDEIVKLDEPVQVSLESEPVIEPQPVELQEKRELGEDEFYLSDVKPGETALVYVNGDSVAVYNVEGEFYATQDECTHAFGPLNEGLLEGHNIICPWHDSCFDVRDGSVCRGPAKDALKTYRVISDGQVGKAVELEG
jgi:nitrite reductase/ring-hydroxylating ferredoxin subunit